MLFMRTKSAILKNLSLISFAILSMDCFSQEPEQKHFSKLKIGVLPSLETHIGSNSRQRGTEISQVIGWYIANGLAVGPGAGIVSYTSPNITLIPFYGSLNYTPRVDALGPALYGNLGYAIATNRSTSGGVVAEAGLGWKFGLGQSSRIGPEVGYRIQRYGLNYGNLGSMDYKLKSLSIGLVLNY